MYSSASIAQIQAVLHQISPPRPRRSWDCLSLNGLLSMSDELATRVVLFLDAHHVMSLATFGEEGPHAANLFYVRDGFSLIWVSDPDSRHSVNIAARPQVAVTIAPDYSDYSEIMGLQIAGKAERIARKLEQVRAQNLLRTRYPFIERLPERPQKLIDAYERTQFYLLRPARIVLIDNKRGFGSKEILEIHSNL